MLLNCDLGESYGNWTMGLDEEVMQHIHQANIACGFHAGDPLTIEHTLSLAARLGVSVGAHPAYPDLVGFGRRSMALSADELRATLRYQIAALDGLAACHGLSLAYVKPHGALYNDMMASADIRATVMHTVASYHRPLALMLQATPAAEQHREEAAPWALPLIFEAFADRAYDDQGQLVSRRQPGAVHDHRRTLEQVEQLVRDGSVTTLSGRRLPLCADTLCVHGDNPEAVRMVAEIRTLIDAG